MQTFEEVGRNVSTIQEFLDEDHDDFNISAIENELGKRQQKMYQKLQVEQSSHSKQQQQLNQPQIDHKLELADKIGQNAQLLKRQHSKTKNKTKHKQKQKHKERSPSMGIQDAELFQK